MRRIIMFGTALAVLTGATVAFAAGNFDTFTATWTFQPNHAGSTSSPAPMGSHEVWTAKGSNGGNAAPLTKIVADAYGITYNGNDFPVCTASMINSAGTSKNWNAVCPKGSLIGGGPIQAQLTSSKGGGGTSCDPYLDIYNGGKNAQTFFFVVGPQSPGGKYSCAGGSVKTGTGCAAYTGNISYTGKTSVVTINLPGCASTNAGGLGLYAALQKLDVTYKNSTTKKNGKTIGYSQSFACLNGKRPWSFTFTAQNFKGQSPSTQTTKIAGSDACS